jgi:hypothetical protein
MSGNYVTGDGEVWITDEEAERIAAHLGMPLQRFHHQYVRAYSKVEGFKLLKAKNNPVSAAGALVCVSAGGCLIEVGGQAWPWASLVAVKFGRDQGMIGRHWPTCQAACVRFLAIEPTRQPHPHAALLQLAAGAGIEKPASAKPVACTPEKCHPCALLQARDCVFLQPDNTCSIHKVRPVQCSTYPW